MITRQSMYSRYESGSLDIPLDAAAKLVKYYNVSMDYLMGLTDDPSPYDKKTGGL